MRSGIIATDTKLEKLYSFIQSYTEFAFDTETDGLSHDRKWIGLSFAVRTSESYLGWYVPTAHERGDDLFSVEPDNANKLWVDKIIDHIFKDGNRVWIQNAKFDLGVLRNEGYHPEKLRAEVLDTKCVSWLLEPERQCGHGLKALVPAFLGKEMGSFTQFKAYTKNAYVPVGEMGKYAIDDAIFLLELAHKMYPQLSPSLLKVFHELEMPIMRILEEVEHFGFRVDTDKLATSYKELVKEADAIEKQFKDLFGPTAQITSSQWLSKNLCGQLWGVAGKKTGTSGFYSTDKDSLDSWAAQDVDGTTDLGAQVAKLVLRHRQVTKLANTYCKSLVDVADQAGRVHGNFNQWGTGTGRMSSSNPNMQNIPSSRTPEGDLIRKSFISAPGYKLIVADYSQIELRVMAHLSGDPIMSSIYQENGDIHQMTADACNCARFDAKAINFGLIYKMGAKTLGKTINKTEAEAQDYIDRYFENYQGVASHQERLIAKCRDKGFTWTITGRRRPLLNINSDKFGLKAGDERKAINTQVQGSAADIIKIGMRNFHRRLRAEGYTEESFRIIGQVHDEVVVEVLEESAEYVSSVLQSEMENCVKLNIPLIAEPCIADSWGEAK